MIMSTVEAAVPPLVAGDFLSREEFLRRWEATPNIQRAELIGGVVYMPPSPLGADHGFAENDLGAWLGVYRAATPGCRAANNATWLMGEDSPQPDTSLCILAEYGGQSRVEGRYLSGAPEFLSEVCVSRTAYDLHQKLNLYEQSGVQEYLAVLMREHEVRWHRLINGRFEVVPLSEDGIYRSAVFPGLWLDAAALLRGDLAGVLAVLNEGIVSREHQEFVALLAARRS
jgi:hypothetical protein